MKRFITQFSRLNNQNVTATADADANHDNRATVEPLRIRSARAAAAFPRLSTDHNARAKRTAAEIRADLTSWSNAGPRDELRRDAADMINGCLQRNDDTLYLSHLGLSSLPNSICELVHLKELTVDHNNLSEIPGEIEKLKNLERVDFSSNKIVQLPENIGALKKLKSIKVSDNRISSLPQNIGGIEILLNFQIDSNRVSQLPSTIYGLGSGAIAFTHNNPISTTDRFIIAAQMRRSDYKGPVIFQKGSEPRKGRAYEPDPFSTMTDLEKIETLLASAEEMSDGRYEAPVNFCMGGEI